MGNDATLARNRLADRVRMLRNPRLRPDEGKGMKDDNGMENMAFPEGSWE